MMKRSFLVQFVSTLLLIGALVFVQGCKSFKSPVAVKSNTSEMDTIPLTEEEKLTFEYTFTEAVKQKLLGNFDNALSLLYQSLEIHPNSAAVMHEISTINELSDNYDVALKYAEKAFANDQNNKWFGMHLAQLYIVEKQYKNAINVYKKMNELHPENLEYLYNLALLYEETDQLESAVESYQAMERIIGVNEQLSLAMNSLYKRMGKSRKAENELEKLIEKFPSETRYYGILAEMYAADKDYRKAQRMYDKLFEIDSTNRLGRLSQLEYYKKTGDYDKFFKQFDVVLADTSIAFQNKVLVFVSLLNSPKEMSEHFQDIRKRILYAKEKYPDQPDIYTLHADFLVKMQKFKEAIGQLKTVVEFGNAKWVIWEQLLSLQSFTGDFENMQVYAKRATDSFPNKPTAFLYAGMGALFNDNPDMAITFLKKGNRLVLSDETELQVNFYTYLGEAYNDLGNYTQSDYYFDKVLKLDSTNIFVLNNYAYYLSLREENLHKALELSKQSLKQRPEDPTYLDTYAWILYKLGKYDEALKAIEKALEKGGGKDPDVLDHYGDILNANNQVKDALIYWNLSQSLGNKSSFLESKIDAAEKTTESNINLNKLKEDSK